MNVLPHLRAISVLPALALFAWCIPAFAGESALLWEIGSRDNDTQELALGRHRYAEFREDPLFIVGQSSAASDWPYCHPGPRDVWAGNRQHPFTIAFALRTTRIACRGWVWAFQNDDAFSNNFNNIAVNLYLAGFEIIVFDLDGQFAKGF